MENIRAMPIQSWGKSGMLVYFVPKIGHIFWDMDFKFVFPIIFIDINTIWKSIWLKFAILSSKKPQKWPYLKI